MERHSFKMFLDPGMEAGCNRRRDVFWPALHAPPGHPVMRRWREHMKDLMLAHPDGSPAAQPLRELFHMP